MMKVFTVLVCVVLSLAACNAATLRGAPDVVLASTAYMVKSADQQIEATEKDLQDKKEAFKLRVIEEKKVVEKTKNLKKSLWTVLKLQLQRETTQRNKLLILLQN
jgi:Na+/phosphate symporter